MLWVKQSNVGTDTPRNRSRTAYFDPLAPKIQSTIRNYYAASPTGEAVTPAVFAEIGPDEVQALLAPGRDLDAARREFGLRILLELVYMYGESRVETWRRQDGRTAAPRRTGHDWPRNYTPHRVRFDAIDSRISSSIALGESLQPRELWRQIFEAWFDVLGDYREHADDLGWWHNESSNVSLLAGAIWRIGGVCISEYGVSRDGATQPGRADLWFRLEGQAVDVECKMVWPRTDDEFAGGLVNSRLDDARLQLDSVSAHDRSPLRYTACFVVPAVTGPVPDASPILDAVSAGVLDDETAVARFEPQGDQLANIAWRGFKFPAVMLVVRRVH